ncbi:MAG: class I SAM-dependent methyltransferase [Candidatus Nezhaarchaeales archaeon]
MRLRKARIRRLYNLTSEFYDELYGYEQEKKSTFVLNFLGNSKFNVILDAGCGTGLITEKLQDKGAFIVGVDFSKGMLHRAKEKLSKVIKMDFVLSDIEYLPFRSKSFDLVLSITVLQNCNPLRAFKSLSRVLSNDGVMILSYFKRSKEVKKLEAKLKDYVLKNLDSIDNVVILSREQAMNLIDGSSKIEVKAHGIAH